MTYIELENLETVFPQKELNDFTVLLGGFKLKKPYFLASVITNLTSNQQEEIELYYSCKTV